MAIDELNAKGVMIGGKKAKFELLAEERPASKHDGRCASLDFMHKWTEIEKKKWAQGTSSAKF